MDQLSSSELLRFLEDEANMLHLMHAKVTNQLHCFQVEEEFFIRELEKLRKELEAAGECGKSPEDEANPIVWTGKQNREVDLEEEMQALKQKEGHGNGLTTSGDVRVQATSPEIEVQEEYELLEPDSQDDSEESQDYVSDHERASVGRGQPS